MARCTTSGEEFIHFVFGPCVSVLTSSDVERRCTEDNLTFAELLRPFSKLTKDGNGIRLFLFSQFPLETATI